MSSRYLSPGFWRNAIAAYGIGGVFDAGLRSVGVRKRSEDESPTHVDVVGRIDDPVEALYVGGELGQTPVIRVPMNSLRTEKLGVAVDDVESNPFTRTVYEYVTNQHLEYAGSSLDRFLKTWQPATLAEFLGIRDTDGVVLTQPLESEFFPWEQPLTHDSAVARRLANERTWVLKFGPARGGRHGSSHYGPTSEAVGRYRFEKHTKLALSVAADARANGTTSDTWWDPQRGGYVEGQVFVDGPTRGIVVREGKHRTAAVAALGVDQIVLSLPSRYPVIRRQDVEVWPGVRSGVFTVGEALQVFDRFMAGRLPDVAVEPAAVGSGDAA